MTAFDEQVKEDLDTAGTLGNNVVNDIKVDRWIYSILYGPSF